MKTVLVTGGTDPTAGAGVSADLEAIAARGLRGVFAVTAVTAQHAGAVEVVSPVGPELVRAQIDAASRVGPIDAVKTGMLVDAPTVCAVADAVVALRRDGADVALVVDPVLAASAGAPLIDEAGEAAMRERLFPLADVVTPNVPEASRLSGIVIDSLATMREAALALAATGPRAVVITGGHADFAPATDGLWDGVAWHTFAAEGPVRPIDARGTGCRFAAALAAGLALGEDLATAVAAARRVVGTWLRRVD